MRACDTLLGFHTDELGETGAQAIRFFTSVRNTAASQPKLPSLPLAPISLLRDFSGFRSALSAPGQYRSLKVGALKAVPWLARRRSAGEKL